MYKVYVITLHLNFINHHYREITRI